MRALLLIALAACASSTPSLDPAKLDTLDYGAPAGWKSRDVSAPQTAAVEWTPTGDNDRKESLVISRVPQPALAAARSRPHLRRTLVAANAQLPDARFSSPTPVVTRGGFSGLRVEGTFTPPTQAVSYHRIHAVLVDGTSLVHVLYTARDPDRDYIGAVLDGLQPGA
jgi:hypothetical protein